MSPTQLTIVISLPVLKYLPVLSLPFSKKTPNQCSHHHDPAAPCRAVDILLGQGAGEGHAFRASYQWGNVECFACKSLLSMFIVPHRHGGNAWGCVHVCWISWLNSFPIVSFPSANPEGTAFYSFTPLVISACSLQMFWVGSEKLQSQSWAQWCMRLQSQHFQGWGRIVSSRPACVT